VQPGRAQRRPGLDHVADGVGDAEPAGGLHRAVQLDHRGGDALLVEEAPQQHRVGRGDPLAGQLVDALDAGLHRAGEAERGAAEAQRHDLHRCRALSDGRRGLEEHVPPGDADVQGAGGDVDGDVAGPQVEELGVAVRVVDGEVLGAAALPVPALGEHGGRGLAQDALVGHGDAQHGWTPSVGFDRGWLSGGQRQRWA
jgi:hypothetical protein